MICRQSHVRHTFYSLMAGLALLAAACSSDNPSPEPASSSASSPPFAAAAGAPRPPRDTQPPLPAAPVVTPASSTSPLDFDLPEGPVLTDVSLDGAPSYLFLFTHTEDHINHEMSEERYWRIGPMLEAVAAEYPDLDLTWTIEFMGADAETIAERNPETGLVDYLLSLRDKGLVEFGYHAQHEPTYNNRPQNALSAEPSYDQAHNALWTWITCRKDPLYGGCIAERGGGIDAILDTFGQVQLVTGYGVGSGAQFERSAGSRAVLSLLPQRMLGFGFPDHGALQRNREYVAARDALMTLLTPTHETSSGTFWMDNSVRINDAASVEGVNAGGLEDGPDSIAADLAGLDGTRSFVLNLGIASKYLYTVDGTSPTIWAYSNPRSPELPPDLLRSQADRELGYTVTEQSLEYLAQTVTESNGDLSFVGADDVVGLFTSQDYWQVDEDELEQMTLWLLNHWEGAPPSWVYDGEDFYSLADAFALLTAALQGSLDEADVVSKVYGPWSAVQPQTPGTSVSSDALRDLLDSSLITDNRIAETYDAGSATLTATQLLYALGTLYVMDRYQVDATDIQIPVTASAPPTSAYLEALGCINCLDTAWSLKPARFQGAAD